jgi:hypothetical protein
MASDAGMTPSSGGAWLTYTASTGIDGTTSNVVSGVYLSRILNVYYYLIRIPTPSPPPVSYTYTHTIAATGILYGY